MVIVSHKTKGENTLNIEKAVNEMVEQEKEQFEAFAVADLETAAEAMRRVMYFNEQQEAVDRIIEQQIVPFMEKIEKIKAWGAEAKKEHVERENYYKMLLEQYTRNQIAEQEAAGKKPKKTVSLPYGKISLKKQQPEFIKDEEALLEFAKSSGFVKVKETTDWAELKKSCKVYNGMLVDEDGEVVPGVKVVEKDDKFELKLD